MKASKEYDFKLAKEAGLALDRWPESDEEAKRAEEFLAKDLANLSLDEHERALFDIHGITPVDEEDPASITQSLEKLQMTIDQIESKEAYDLASRINPNYVQSTSFRLMFLRCQDFDINAAAKMIVGHFEQKSIVFGSGEILAREVRQSDLNGTEMVMLRTGYLQILPVRDAAGRCIIALTSGPVNDFPVDYGAINECRVMWYQTMSMLRDEETQKRGVVYLLMNFTSFKVTVQDFSEVMRMEAKLPVKLASGHYCYNDPDLTPFIRGFQIMVSEHERCRMRVHFGNRDDLDFTLQTYGIPTEVCPLKRDGSFSIENHRVWLEMLRAQEERVAVSQSSTVDEPDQQAAVVKKEVIGIPGRFDVLFGKSVLARNHTGTRRALHVVEMHYHDYEQAQGKFEKTDIAEKVMCSKFPGPPHCIRLQKISQCDILSPSVPHSYPYIGWAIPKTERGWLLDRSCRGGVEAVCVTMLKRNQELLLSVFLGLPPF